jgi:hypothetical protein
VDANCINPGDVTERNSQVSLMARIYSLARQVVVWLGPGQDDGKFALTLFDSWGSKVEIDWITMIITRTIVARDETYLGHLAHGKTVDQRETLALFHLMN